jgi:hypothetical protein
VWSLGVMAFELLTGEPALHMTEGKDRVRSSSGLTTQMFTEVEF